jgi:hypothetical protein
VVSAADPLRSLILPSVKVNAVGTGSITRAVTEKLIPQIHPLVKSAVISECVRKHLPFVPSLHGMGSCYVLTLCQMSSLLRMDIQGITRMFGGAWYRVARTKTRRHIHMSLCQDKCNLSVVAGGTPSALREIQWSSHRVFSRTAAAAIVQRYRSQSDRHYQ